MCQQSVAHLTRMGNSRTPEKTDSFPRSAVSIPSVGREVTSAWKRSKRFFTSRTDLPLIASVISEADAVEMAQPRPWKPTSFTTSPSSTRCTTT